MQGKIRPLSHPLNSLVLPLVVWCVLSLAGAAHAALSDTTRYVAMNGNDSWSGKLSAPNSTLTDGPFLTLTKARDAVRTLKQTATTPITVYFRGGTYYQSSTVGFSSNDSGTAAVPITYASYPGEQAVISGGRRITGFYSATLNGCSVKAAYIQEVQQGTWYFTQLFVNGARRNRTRLPADPSQYYRSINTMSADWTVAEDRFKYYTGNIDPNWYRPTDIEVTVPIMWFSHHMKISSIDGTNRIVYFTQNSSVFGLTPEYGVDGRYCVENVREAFDTPGEWYLDKPSGVLYYYPMPGEDMSAATVEAPKLDFLITLYADAVNGYVDYVNFANLKFSHNYANAAETGWCQAAYGLKGALYLCGCRNCSVKNCTFSQLGTYGVQVAANCSNVSVQRNVMTDLGGGGVNAQGAANTSNLSVDDNDISDCGRIYPDAVGVIIGNTGNNQIRHNHIRNLDYAAISIGWYWGYGGDGHDTIVEYNNLHDYGRGVLSDLGGIYSLGLSPGTKIRNNLIHDGYSYDANLGWGVFLDEGTSFMELYNNVIYNTKSGAFNQHYGQENWVHNNVLAYGTNMQLTRTRPESHISFMLDHNIIYYNSGNLMGYDWSGNNYTMDYNVYYDTRLSNPNQYVFGASPYTWTWSQWRGSPKYQDVHSAIVDPLFRDPAGRDFSLLPNSPAISMGFQPIDISTVGPRYATGVTWEGYPVITTHPVSQTVRSGQPATLSVTATGSGLSYQWYFKTAGTTSFSAVSGATASSYTVNPFGPGKAGEYYCVVTNTLAAVASNLAVLKARGVVCDVDGDGDTDIGEYRTQSADTGRWYAYPSSLLFVNGVAGDFPLWGDFDGDAKMDAANNRPVQPGQWYVRYSGGVPMWNLSWGVGGRIPLAGDFNGDGKSELAEFNPLDGHWQVCGQTYDVYLGQNGDIPVPGDYDGDDKADACVFRPGMPGTWYIRNSSDGTISTITYGNSNHLPLCGDYNGDGKAEIGVFDPTAATPTFKIRGVGDTPVPGAVAGDIPLVGDYNGDGKTDYGVYHPDDVTGSDWIVLYNGGGSYTLNNWGLKGRVPFASSIVGLNGLIYLHPVSQSKNLGESVTFTVAAQGQGLAYQWYKDGVAVSGATAASYTRSSLVPADAGLYKCRVTNWVNAQRYSFEAQLTVNGPTTPVVTDDGVYTTSTIQLHAMWTATDPAGIAEYQYAIGSSVGGTDVVDWTSTGVTASVTRTRLLLDTSLTYYFSVKARNVNDVWSLAGGSDGIRPALTTSSIALLKGYPDGQCVHVAGRVVSAKFGESFYIQDPDRLSGIKVTGVTVNEGSVVTVTGVLSTAGSERVITQARIE